MLGVALDNPLIWAVLVGWIISVVLHEFAHGLVAHLGGDYTIKERGGLSLNPLQYVHPVNSIVFPAIMLMMGAIPLPGGATYVRRDLLRSRGWDSAVSLAGPAMNVLLFFACVLPLHPALGWIDPHLPMDQWSNFQIFLGAMAVLQMMAAVLNLAPVPPLDGFHAIEPYLPFKWRVKLANPAVSQVAFFAYFLVLWRTPLVGYIFRGIITPLLLAMGFSDVSFIGKCYNTVFFGSP